MVVGNIRQVGILKIVHTHGKTFVQMLPDEGLHHTIGLSRAGCANHHGCPEGIYQVDPALPLPVVVLIEGKQIHRPGVIKPLFLLRKTLIFRIETVFHQLHIDEFGDVVKAYVQNDEPNY